mmetsp:Transcript_15795/g.31740  ORF Transcript_15795/g.31740 Transcript_15795/m.31740 type:complete len:86 (-) Transcript_15795:875-1132(-)
MGGKVLDGESGTEGECEVCGRCHGKGHQGWRCVEQINSESRSQLCGTSVVAQIARGLVPSLLERRNGWKTCLPDDNLSGSSDGST